MYVAGSFSDTFTIVMVKTTNMSHYNITEKNKDDFRRKRIKIHKNVASVCFNGLIITVNINEW